MVPRPTTVEYPTILDLPAPRIRGYTRESVIAETLRTMVGRGLLNSRMRDFFDVWALSRPFDFGGGILAVAVRETFPRRALEVCLYPGALTEEFAADTGKATPWQGFLRKSRPEGAPGELVEGFEAIAIFLGPVAEALHEGKLFEGRWAPGPWCST